MTTEREYTRVEKDVIKAVKNANQGDWVVRSDITRFLDRKSFSNAWSGALERLTNEGVFEAEKVQGSSREGYIWRYKIKA